MSFIKRGDAQPILKIIKKEDALKQKNELTDEELEILNKNKKNHGNKYSSNTESNNN